MTAPSTSTTAGASAGAGNPEEQRKAKQALASAAISKKFMVRSLVMVICAICDVCMQL